LIDESKELEGHIQLLGERQTYEVASGHLKVVKINCMVVIRAFLPIGLFRGSPIFSPPPDLSSSQRAGSPILIVVNHYPKSIA